jgi:hypothetical protein
MSLGQKGVKMQAQTSNTPLVIGDNPLVAGAFGLGQ